MTLMTLESKQKPGEGKTVGISTPNIPKILLFLIYGTTLSAVELDLSPVWSFMKLTWVKIGFFPHLLVHYTSTIDPIIAVFSSIFTTHNLVCLTTKYAKKALCIATKPC